VKQASKTVNDEVVKVTIEAAKPVSTDKTLDALSKDINIFLTTNNSDIVVVDVSCLKEFKEEVKATETKAN